MVKMLSIQLFCVTSPCSWVFQDAIKCAYLTECGVLVYLSRTWRWRGVCVWWTDCRVVGGGRSGRVQGWAAQNEAGVRVRVREKEDISVELVTVGRGRAPFQLAWRLYQGMCVTGGLGGAVHWAAPSLSRAQRESDVIHLVGCGVVFPLFDTACVFLFALPAVGDHVSPYCAYPCMCLRVWSH